MDVHHPYHPPKEHQLQFRDEPVGARRAVKLRRKMLEKPDGVSKKELQELIDLYDGEIRFFDTEARRLIETIRGLWGNDTIVAVTSDHGDELADHGGFNHHSTYFEEIIHVPLIVDVDDTSGLHDDIVELLDVAPTLLDYVGIDQPDSYVGKSLRAVIQSDSWEKSAAIIEQSNSCAYRDQRWKLIVRNETPRVLYDLRNDPREKNNVIDEHMDVVQEIERTLTEHQSHVDGTDREIETVEIDGETRDRLEQLGYLQDN